MIETSVNYLIITAVVTVFISCGLASTHADGVSSSTTRLGIDEKSGSISSLIHTPADRDFAGPSAVGTGPFYSVEFADPTVLLTSKDAVGARVTTSRDGALMIESRHDKPFAFTVTCRLRPEPNTPFITGRISLHSDQPCRIVSVTFPIIHLSLPLSGTGADDAVVLPSCDGVTMLDPLKNNLWLDLAYPGGASMQFFGAYDKSAGVYLASRDSEGYSKQLSAHRKDKILELSIRHGLAQTQTTDWSLPYDIALTTFDVSANSGAGWEIAADLYRPWALQQPWCKNSLAQRIQSGDIPKWLAEPSLFYAFALAGRLPDGKDGIRTALVADHAESWRQVVGGPVTFMLMSWEKQGPWVAPDYFPPLGDGDAFSAVTRALHDNGHRTLVFLSGLNWTLRKTPRRGYPAIDNQAPFNLRAKACAISDLRGEAILYGQPAEDVGQYARICPATPLADELLRDVTLKCQDYGIDCVQADQLVGGGSPPCSHPEHSHPRSGGNWSAKALYNDLARARKAGKAKSADFAFSIEEPGEFFIPLLDTYHARDYIQNRWPRSGVGALGVPLFTHVYHDYCLGYGGDSVGVSATPSATALYAQGMNLVCGKAPAVSTWGGWLDPATVDASQKRLLRSHFDLWRGPARDYLVFGKRVTSTPPAVPNMQITYTDWPSGKKQTLAVPSVLSATYELSDGRRGQILACIAHAPVTVLLADQPLCLDSGQAVFQEFK